MADKYQILVDVNKHHAVIERTSNGNGKEFWNVYIPDAGDGNSARRVARLLNEETQRDEERRAQRVPSDYLPGKIN